MYGIVTYMHCNCLPAVSNCILRLVAFIQQVNWINNYGIAAVKEGWSSAVFLSHVLSPQNAKWLHPMVNGDRTDRSMTTSAQVVDRGNTVQCS